MPSDANCITTTNNVHTDSILYECKKLYLIHTLTKYKIGIQESFQETFSTKFNLVWMTGNLKSQQA